MPFSRSRPAAGVRRRVAVAAALTALTGVVTGCAPGPDGGGAGPPPSAAASATGAPPSASRLRPGDRYVALGSSFAAGPGLTPVADAPCRRSSVNYPAQVARALGLELTDVSCAATTTDNVLTKPHDTGDDRRAPQIEAVGPDARLVTLTIGGNDAGYATLLDDLACAANGTCPGVTPDGAAAVEAADGVTDRLVTTLEAVRERAPEALVLLVGYPQVVPAGGGTCPALALPPEDARSAAAVAERLQQAFRTAADRAGAGFVDVYAASADHSACSAQPWVGGWIRDEQYRGPRSFHPTAEGMRAQAELVVAATAAT